MKLTIVFMIALIIVSLQENEAARKRSSRRSPSRKTPSRKTPSRKTPSRKTPSRSKSKSTTSRKPKIDKTSNMPIKTYNSPVIIKQTKYVSSSSKYPKYLAAGAAGAITYYALTRAPVYRGYYPMYGSHLRVPQHRGVRVMEERQEIVNRYTNERCYQVTTTRVEEENKPSVEENTSNDEKIDKQLENPVNSTTIVAFDGEEEQVFADAKNISLDESKINKNFTATTITDYAGEIPGTQITKNCTRVITSTRASMIQVYNTNPYASAAFVEPTSSFVLIVTLLLVCYKISR